MVYRKTKSTEERKEARRRLILDTSTRLFGKHGYHATTVPMIVREAGVSTGSFYMYFRNKEDIFNAALEELGRTVTQVLDGATAGQTGDSLRMGRGIEALFLFLARNPEQARILIVESSGLSPRLEQTRRSILRHEEEKVQQMLEANLARFRVENPGIAACCIVGATFEALCRWLEEDPAARMPAAEVARAVAEFNARATSQLSHASR